jgi:drug/metabolite transporter (DMT)-like permease
VILLSLTTLPPLLRAPGGLRAAINAVPWWWALLFGWGRLQWTAWQAMAIQYAPNPGFAKMAVNLNTVWATIAGVVVFGGRLRSYHIAGVALSLGGNFLCTSGGPAKTKAEDRLPPLPSQPLARWLVPALLASACITSVEMTARALTAKHNADASLFAQTQMAASGLVALLKLLRRRLKQDPKQTSYGSGGSEPEPAASGVVPLYIVAGIAVVRNFSQSWMAQCIQNGPNPGLPKTVSGGVNTVLATLVGVICFGSSLTPSNGAGIALSIVGTYLCVR